ncbi:MAG: (deoxy)nucleoside triphosphate pyrophosphohydrolase [Burkholderiales bacterium]
MPVPIPVVCALIERDGRVLLAQRPAGRHLALQWEFPGGKVEPGEEPAAALRREIREELGCDIVIGRELRRFEHTYGTTVIEMIPFVCALMAGTPEPHPHEHIALAWVVPRELESYDLAAADLPVVRAYCTG